MAGSSAIDREIQEIESQLLQYKQAKAPAAVDPRIVRQWRTCEMVFNKESEMDFSSTSSNRIKTP